MTSAGTTGGNGVINLSRRSGYAIVVAVSIAFALVNAFSSAHDAQRLGAGYNLTLPLFWEFTSIAVIVALLPLIERGAGYLRRQRSWPRRLGWGAVLVVAFSALHIVGMVALRKLGMASVGSSYSFGFTPSELLYEFRKDVVTCLLIGLMFWVAARRRDDAPAEAIPEQAPTRATPEVLWLRDGAARIRIEAGDVVCVSSAGNYVEFQLTDGRTHLVRGTLAAEEARLASFNIVRVHRTRLVNLRHVSQLRPGADGDFELTLDGGQTVAGSRRYRQAVRSLEELATAASPVSPPPQIRA